MKTTIQYKEQFIQVDLSKPIDISIPLTNTDENPIAWYIDKPIIEPVVFGDWMGSVSKGKSSGNFSIRTGMEHILNVWDTLHESFTALINH